MPTKTINYKGGKDHRAYDAIAKHFPQSHDRFIDSFCGSAKMGIRHRELHETPIWLNDIWVAPVSFFTRCRDDLATLQSELHNIWNYIRDHEDKAYTYYHSHFHALDKMEPNEQAVHIFLISRLAHSGNMVNGGFSPLKWKRNMYRYIDALSELSDLLQGQEITNLDYREVFAATMASDLNYCDPPYLAAQEDLIHDNGKQNQYYRNWKLDIQDLMATANAAPCHTIISYDVVPQLLSNADYGWHFKHVPIWHYPKRQRVNEVILINY